MPKMLKSALDDYEYKPRAQKAMKDAGIIGPWQRDAWSILRIHEMNDWPEILNTLRTTQPAWFR